MKLKIKRKEVGTLSSRVSVKDRETKKVLYEDEGAERFNVKVPEGKSVAMVRDVAGITVSLDYNSASVQVGIEMPMPVTPGSMSDASKAMDRVERLVEKRLERKAKEVRSILKELSAATRRR